jgi:hypothetical protein
MMFDNPSANPITMRAAIYNGGMFPAQQVVLSSVVAADDGVVLFDIPATPLAAGTYWIAYCSYNSSYSLRSAVGSTSTLTYLGGEAMPDPFIDYSATPVPTPPPLLTTGLGTVWVELCETGGVTATDTPTITPTYTPDAGGVYCFNPRVWDFKDSLQTYTYEYLAGNSLPGRAYAYFLDLTYRLGWYDGADLLVDESDVVSNSGGYLTRDYTIQASDTPGTWHFVIADAGAVLPSTYLAGDPSFLDEAAVSVVVGRPTPLPTPPCSNMLDLYCDKGFSMQRFQYILDACTVLYVQDRYVMSGNQIVAYYDGNDQLVSADLQILSGGNISSSYHMTGSEAPGTWHVTVYQSTSTPPATYGGAGDVVSCPTLLTFTVQ